MINTDADARNIQQGHCKLLTNFKISWNLEQHDQVTKIYKNVFFSKSIIDETIRGKIWCDTSWNWVMAKRKRQRERNIS